MPEFSQDQVDWICQMIGLWYLEWKHKICDYDHKEHCLGFAKERLKEMICPNYPKR
jgi:hypothetical protein